MTRAQLCVVPGLRSFGGGHPRDGRGDHRGCSKPRAIARG
jgi:hypothetical protein